MLAPSKGFPEPWWEEGRTVRFTAPHDSYAFWAICLPAGIVMAAMWLAPFVWGFYRGVPYLYAFFANLQ